MGNNLVPDVYAASIITFVPATASFAARWWARSITGISLWWDDWFVIIAYFFAVAYNCASWAWIQTGVGQHLAEIPGDPAVALRNASIHIMVAELTYATSLAFVKFSILAFYWRMFKTSPIKIPIMVLFALSMIWLIIRTFMSIFHCIPVYALWEPNVPGATCIDGSKFFTASTSAHLGLDILIMALPVFQIGRLKLKKTQRLGVSLLFLFGTLTCIASICLVIRAVALNPKTTDLTYDIAPIIIWASVEVNLAVIAACLPLLRPIFSRLLNKMHVGSNDKSSGAGMTGDYQHTRPKSFVRIGTRGGTRTGGEGGRSKVSDDTDSTYELAKSPIHGGGTYPVGNGSADSMERGDRHNGGFDGGHSRAQVTITGVAPEAGSSRWGSTSVAPGGIMVKNETSIQVSHGA
ncbi:uncharacterized protein B0I36DRAFT_424778 [Microdochium trichocladiopsis]|uniref:Rhodopsin domain-containing protein n=1 Tax=Microdochium trichocladiopsis TaxID=1682393 RepID=A0A9P8XWN6_9PEZI|nr:uncharacterized protein B0I36DRAFT_424778 [Microdochium trichocladiopsis]KAH7020747.1 hypothetical protein B0I36DRAFT_424778 [Microdochium trichocladiopsis]